MKMLACECGHKIRGKTDEEVMDKMWEHIKAVHPEMAEEMNKKPKDEQNKSMEKMRSMIVNEE